MYVWFLLLVFHCTSTSPLPQHVVWLSHQDLMEAGALSWVIKGAAIESWGDPCATQTHVLRRSLGCELGVLQAVLAVLEGSALPQGSADLSLQKQPEPSPAGGEENGMEI